MGALPERGLGFGRGRLVLIVVLCAYAAALAAAGGPEHWNRLGVGPMRPAFADARAVTSAWDCERAGVAVLPENPCDPWRRPANFPRALLLPARLGLGVEATVALGWLIAVAFFVALVVLLPAGATASAGLVYAAAAVSPSVMLGIERGNVDMMLWAGVVAAVVAAAHSTRGRLLAHALVLLLAVLKLFPIFSAPSLARRGGRVAAASVALLGAFTAYVVWIRHELRAIAEAVPQSDDLSYGAGVVASRLFGSSSTLVEGGVVAIGLVGAFAAHRALADPVPAAVGDVRARDAFVAGACIYLATFALFNNYDYRLTFLLLTLPQLLLWARSSVRGAKVMVALVLVTLWTARAWPGIPGVDRFGDAAAWTLFAALGGALAALLVRRSPRSSDVHGPSATRPVNGPSL